MFNILSKELNLSNEQSVKVQERRHKISELYNHFNESLTLIRDLKVNS